MVNELAGDFGVHPNRVGEWNQALLRDGTQVFASATGQRGQVTSAKKAELYEQIGPLKMELEWLKKKLPEALEVKRQLVEPDHPQISLRRQCELIDLNRSSWYYQPAGESAYNLELLRLIDKQYTRTPFYGWPRMTAHLRRQGHEINGKRVRRLMRLMGLQAIYPRPKTTIVAPDHRIYPYLLRNLPITRCNQV